MSDLFPKSIELKKRSLYERIIVAKVLLESVLDDLPSVQPEIIRCKDCKWFNKLGCAIWIKDDSDKPTENDYCSFAEKRGDSDD